MPTAEPPRQRTNANRPPRAVGGAATPTWIVTAPADAHVRPPMPPPSFKHAPYRLSGGVGTLPIEGNRPPPLPSSSVEDDDGRAVRRTDLRAPTPEPPPTDLGFWCDPHLEWGGDMLRREDSTMQFESSVVEDEYNRWMQTEATRAALLPVAFHIALVVWAAVWLARERDHDAWEGIASLVIALVAAVVASAEALRSKRSTVDTPADGPSSEFERARCTALRRVRTFHCTLGVLNTLLIVMSCAGSFRAFSPIVRKYNGIEDCDGHYAVVALPLYLVGANTVIYAMRWFHGALLTAVYVAAFTISAITMHDCLDGGQRALLSATYAGFAAAITIIARPNERMLRERFEHVARLQAALRDAQRQQEELWRLVRLLVPEALLPRVRGAATIRSLALLDHTACGVVSVATLRDPAAVSPSVSPSAVVDAVFRAFAAFDSILGENGASPSGFDKLFVTGDTYVACAGLIGEGRSSALVSKAVGEPDIDSDDGVVAPAADAPRPSADALVTASYVNVARAVSIALQQAAYSRGDRTPNHPALGVSVGIGYGECWGGINGVILHTRYMLHGEAFDDAVACSRLGVNGQTHLSTKALEALRLAAHEVGEPSADVILTAQEAVPTSVASVVRLAPRASPGGSFGSFPNVGELVAQSPVAPAPAAAAAPTDDLGTTSSLFDMAPALPRDALQEQHSPATSPDRSEDAADEPATERHDQRNNDAVKASPREHSPLPLVPTTNRVRVVDRAAELTGSKTRSRNLSREFADFCSGLDILSQPAIATACLVLLLTTAGVFAIDRALADRRGAPPFGEVSDILFVVACSVFLLLTTIEFVLVKSAWYPKHPLASGALSTLLPLVLVLLLVFGRYTIIGSSAAAAPAHLGMIVLMRNHGHHIGVRIIQYVVLVTVGAVAILAWCDTDTSELKREWSSFGYFVCAVVILGVVSGLHTLYARRVYEGANSCAEWLDRAQGRVHVRERLVEGLVPRHVMRQLVEAEAAAEHGEAWLREQSAMLERRNQSRNGTLGSPTRGPGPRRSVFDDQARFLERWDCLCMTTFRFRVAIQSESNPIRHRVFRQETGDTQRTIDECIHAIRCVDVAAGETSTALRVVHSTGDSVTVAAFPPPSGAAGATPSDEDGATPWPVTVSANMVRRVFETSEIPFTACLVAGVAYGTVAGSKHQYVLMGEAPRLCDELLPLCVNEPRAKTSGSSSNVDNNEIPNQTYWASNVYSTVQTRRRLEFEVQQQQRAVEDGAANCLVAKSSAAARLAFTADHWYVDIPGFGRRAILQLSLREDQRAKHRSQAEPHSPATRGMIIGRSGQMVLRDSPELRDAEEAPTSAED